jgi:hypothetical protein
MIRATNERNSYGILRSVDVTKSQEDRHYRWRIIGICGRYIARRIGRCSPVGYGTAGIRHKRRQGLRILPCESGGWRAANCQGQAIRSERPQVQIAADGRELNGSYSCELVRTAGKRSFMRRCGGELFSKSHPCRSGKFAARVRTFPVCSRYAAATTASIAAIRDHAVRRLS